MWFWWHIIQAYVYDSLTAIRNGEIFSKNSDRYASDLQENPEALPWYYMDSDRQVDSHTGVSEGDKSKVGISFLYMKIPSRQENMLSHG